MMETDVLVNLDDPRTKEIAEAITNKTSKKILQELSKENMSVSEISKNLKLPINTVDYNIKKLAKAGLIERKSFFWSPKGKKMHVYGISKKRIIINPTTLGGKKAYIFAFVITGILALGAKTFFFITRKIDSHYSKFQYTKEASNNVLGSAGIEAATRSADTLPILTIGPIEWFLIGAWLSIILIIAFNYLRKKN